MFEPDRIDSKILSLLQENARLSNKELAASVGLAASTCHERVRRLFEAGIVSGTHARVEPGAIGIGLQAMIGVQLERHSREMVHAFRKAMLQLPEVIAVYHLSGRMDFLLHAAVRDPEHLRNFVLDRLTAREDISRVETSLLFEYARDPRLPDYSRDDDSHAAPDEAA